MPILSIETDVVGLTGVEPSVIYINTSDDLATITGTGYLTAARQNGAILSDNQKALVYGTNLVQGGPGTSFFSVQILDGNVNLIGNSVNAAVTEIIGTNDQVIASNPTGAVTLSLPQSIGTDSSPTFTGLNATTATIGDMEMGNSTIASLYGSIHLQPLNQDYIIMGQSPTAFLNNQGMYFTGTYSLGCIMGIASYTNTQAASPSFLVLARSRATTTSTYAVLQVGDYVSQIEGLGDDGTSFMIGSKIRTIVTGTPSTGVMPCDLQFHTTNTSGTSTLGMTLTNAQQLVLANPLPPASGGAMPYYDEVGNTAMVTGNGYIASSGRTITFTLPATAAEGDTLSIVGNNSDFIIAQAAGQNIFVNGTSTTVGTGGSASSSNVYASIYLVCIVANTTWNCVGTPYAITVV